MAIHDNHKVALVTGATRGIGKAVAARLAADGLFVVGTATSEKGARAVGDHLGGRGAGVALRLDNASSVQKAVEHVNKQFGAPAVLVNNAGVTSDGLLLRMSAKDWQTVLDTNLSGIYRVTKQLLQGMMRARWGRVVSLSSVVARMGNTGQVNYAAAKAGIEGFTRALAQEVGSRDITVNAVAPGFVDTDMTSDLPDYQKQALVARTALGRMGTVDDVAAAVSFLASDAAGYITGEVLHVNGGLYSA